VFHSIGPLTVILSYFEQGEQVVLQIVDKTTYTRTLQSIICSLDRIQLSESFFDLRFMDDFEGGFVKRVLIEGMIGKFNGRSIENKNGKKREQLRRGIFWADQGDIIIGNFKDGLIVSSEENVRKYYIRYFK
jgi:hypothetical protein